MDDTEDSDVSLLIVDDNADTDAGGDDDSNQRNSESVLPECPTTNGAAVADGLEGPAALSLPLPSVSSTMPDPVVVTQNAGRYRHRRHSHRRQRSSSGRHRHRVCRFKRKESNYMSATCHVIVIALVCVAMIVPRWFSVSGGRCSAPGQPSVDSLGIKTFFYHGSGSDFMQRNAYYNYGSSMHDVLFECVTPDVVAVMRAIIALSFIVIIFCLVACLMDMFGPTHVVCRAVRLSASLSILSACSCIVITGLCYLVTEQLTEYYSKTRLHATSKVLVQFSVGFYVMTAAGVMSIIAVACTLIRRVRVSGSRTRRCASSAERPRSVDNDIDGLADIASASRPPTVGRTPPPYRR